MKISRNFFRKRVVQVICALIIIMLVLIATLSLSPKGAIRLRILADGHPLIAATVTPTYDADYSKYIKKNVYDINKSYVVSGDSYTVTMFSVHKQSWYYVANGQPDVA